MKQLFFAFATLALFAACGDTNGAGSVDLATAQDSMYYAVGASIVKNLPVEGVQLSAEQFEKGLEEQIEGSVTMDDQAVGNLIQGMMRELSMRQDGSITDESPINANLDSVSYAYGAYFARNLLDIGMEVRPEYLTAGLHDAVNGTMRWEDDATQERLMKEFSQLAQQKSQEAMEAKIGPNKEAGQQFMAENANKEGVEGHESGMQYQVLQAGPGTGESPTVADVIEIHYEGRLLDGTVFDSSIERGEPVKMPLSQLVQGWQIALPMMKPGDKWRIWLPSELAYGDPGYPPVIPPGATLEFDIEYFGKSAGVAPQIPQQ